jgi:hypothetical protein
VPDVYATANGFIQFPVEEREVNGQTVRDITIRTPGSREVPGGGQLIRITVWPEFSDVDLKEGDWVGADGKLEVREVGDKVYVNLNSVSKFAVVPGVQRAEREVVNKPKKAF